MRYLIPRYIHEACRRGERSGELSGASLFLDLSGFTAMSQALMRQGKVGAEAISKLLILAFAPLEDAVLERGGFITGFAGDALTALFPGGDETAAQALDAALASRRAVESLESDFPIQLKVGLSFGAARWWVFDVDGHWTWVFHGPAVRNCVVSESHAGPGQIIADAALRARILGGRWRELDDGFGALLGAPSPPRPTLASWADAAVDPKIAERFYPLPLWERERPGEFREIYALFLSFELASEGGALEALARHTLQTCDRFGAHFNRIDFADKGGVALLYFGAPIAYEDDASRALRFALEWSRALPPEVLRWRWGIAGGEAYTGAVGDPIRAEYGALGNVVNLSARLAMRAQWGESLVCWGEPPEQRAPTLRCEPLPPQRFKGFPEPIPVWRLLGEHERSSLRQASGPSSMVGRDAELRALHGAVERICRGEPGGLVVIHGDPGIGKSHLVAALHATVSPEVSWWTAHTEPILNRAFDPFTHLLRQVIGLSASSQEVEDAQRLNTWIEALLEAAPAEAASYTEDLRRTRHELSMLLGLGTSATFDTVDARAHHESQMIALIAVLLLESWRHPLILEIEDGHWLDNASWRVLARLGRLLVGRPVLILVSSRYADDGSRVVYPGVVGAPRLELELGTLGDETLRQLAVSTLGGPISEALLTLLSGKTKGNPFFTQQILLWLQERDGLTQRDGVWGLQETALQLPSGVKPLLISRLDRLGPRVRRTVQCAAVLGLEFPLQVLSLMLQSEQTLGWAKRAERARIWSQTYELHYLFQHALLRDAAYEMQLPEVLQQQHRAAAVAIESSHHKDLQGFYADLAYHWGLGREEEKERRYAIAAAQFAEKTYDNAAALRWSARALELIESTSQRLELLLVREQVLERVSDLDQRVEVIAEMEALAAQLDVESVLRVKLRQCALWTTQKRHVECDALLSEAAALADANELWVLADEIACARANWLFLRGRNQEVLESLEPILARGRVSWRPDALNFYASAAAALGRRDEAGVAYQEALQLAVEEGDLRSQVEILNRIAWTLRLQGDRAGAREALEAALQLALQIGDRRSEMDTRIQLGILHGTEGRYRLVLQYLRRAREISRELNLVHTEIRLLTNIGVTYRYMGDFTTARRWLLESMRLNVENQHLAPLHIGGFSLGLIELHEGRPDAALEIVERERDSVEDLANFLGASLALLEGLAWELKGDMTRAEESWMLSFMLREERGHTPLALEAGAGLLRIALAAGDVQGALAWAERILELGDGAALLDMDDPFQAYLSVWRALEAAGDPRADGLLERTHALLQHISAELEPEHRESYLKNIPSQRELLQIWGARQRA